MSVRKSILSHVESRGKTNYISNTRPSISTSLIDSRFIRSKSPRSRQYILRAPKSFLKLSKATRFARVQYFLKRVRFAFTPTAHFRQQWTRCYRRSIFISMVTPRALQQERQRVFMRRLYALPSKLRLSTSRHPKVVKVLLPKASFLQRRARLVQSQAGTFSTTRNKRSVLGKVQRSTSPTTLKRCSDRILSSGVEYARPKCLLPMAIRRTRRMRRKCRVSTRRMHFGVTNFSLPTVRRAGAKFLFKPWSAGLVKKQVVSLAHRPRTPRGYISAAVVRAKFFKRNSGLQVVRKANFAVACSKRVRFRRQTTFDTYRPRL